MERSKVFLWILVFAIAGVIVWRVGFHDSESYLAGIEPKAEGAPSEAIAPEPNEPGDAESSGTSDPNAPADANEPPEPNKPAGNNGPDRQAESKDAGKRPDKTKPEESEPAGDPNAPAEPNEPMEAVNLKDVEMKKIIDKIATWTGKTVIPHEEAMKQKITIYAPKKLPRAKALAKIYSALRMKNFVAEEVDDTIFLKPIADAKLGMVPTVGADEPLAVFENKDAIVRKFFKLDNYPPAQMGQIIQPLVGEYGHVSSDETTNTLLVIDTVSNLMSIQRIISQFDASEAGQTVEEFFEIKNGDPAEIVQLLRMLLGEAPRSSSRGRGSSSRGRPVSPSSRGGSPGKKGSSGSATSVVIGSGDIPLVLIPVPKAGWIIARGAPDDVKQIHEWIQKLDREEPVTAEYETIPITYANTREVASRIEDALRDMPGTELTPSILVRPLEQSKQIMVFGRADLRDMVKKLIEEIDVPSGVFETKVFDLKHADPEQIKENIDSLYGEQIPRYDSYSYYRYGRGSRGPDSETVKVIAFPTMSQVTVIAAPEKMRKIEAQIAEWDVPLDVDAVKPRIIELQNSDPVQLTELLTKLFSEDQNGSGNLFRMIFFGRGGGDQRKKIVGPLYGQLTFEDVPGTKKIIVISKIPQAYDVVEQLIYDLDRQEMAEIPKVVQLKYADPEDLSERLNAMFNEAGTRAPIRRRDEGLRDYSMEEPQNNQQGQGQNNNGGGSNPGEYVPWWSTGARRNMDEEPISNVIGRVRFIPDPRSKSILVLSPPEFQASIEATIRELDVPGKQVMIKAIVIEVDHRDATSLGMQLSSNPADAFGNLGENAVTALGQLNVLEERGSATISVGTDITSLLDFLMKTVNAQILNQQTLWTEDNEEASLFKGDKVAFQTNSSVSEQGGRVTTSFEFERVGMTLAVRPSITPDKSVDMIVNLLLSQLTGDLVNGQPTRREMETTTNMIVQDGQTLMLGGILFQTDSKTERKVPLLGDLPLIGGAFRHYDVSKANTELIIFITPYVVDDGEELSAETVEQIEAPRRKLEEVQDRLGKTADQLKEKVEE